MPDLLFETGTEELPSWYQADAAEALGRLLERAFAAAGISHGAVRVYSTPRRLAVTVASVAGMSERRTEKRRGPPVAAAFDAEGSPTRAAVGFAKTNGVPVESLTVESTDRGDYVYATVGTGGEDTFSLLPGILASLVRELPAPRKMHWGEVEDAFIRPVAWLLARFGDRTVPVSVAGRSGGGTTRGHRFLADREIPVDGPGSYVSALAAASVLADREERRTLTRESVESLAKEHGLVPDDQPDLLEEVTGLVEYPFPLYGEFDAAYLELPEDVLTTVLISHQRFFPLRRPDGKLAPSFVGVSGTRVPDPAVVRRGYEQVLGGRLHDARFFWDNDRQKSLAQHAWGLSGIGYQRELGSMADKVARVGTLALNLAGASGLNDAGQEALRAAVPLFRADLSTGMVFEFPELEGVMAEAYALAEGQPPAVARVLKEGILPAGPGSPLPEGAAGTVLAVAEKLEKVTGFLGIGRRPTGSADPFGLRRDAIGLVRLLNRAGWTLPLHVLVAHAAAVFRGGTVEITEEAQAETVRFLEERLSGLLQDEGLPVRVIRAALAARRSVTETARRAHLLAALTHSADFAELAELYKRAANIARDVEPGAEPQESLFAAEEENVLFAALNGAEAAVDGLLGLARTTLAPWDAGSGPAGREELAELVQAPLQRLLKLKEPLDAFLDNVHVLVEDRNVRRNRLKLLGRTRDVLRRLGDLDELGGIAG